LSVEWFELLFTNIKRSIDIININEVELGQQWASAWSRDAIVSLTGWALLRSIVPS